MSNVNSLCMIMSRWDPTYFLCALNACISALLNFTLLYYYWYRNRDYTRNSKLITKGSVFYVPHGSTLCNIYVSKRLEFTSLTGNPTTQMQKVTLSQFKRNSLYICQRRDVLQISQKHSISSLTKQLILLQMTHTPVARKGLKKKEIQQKSLKRK